MLWVRPRGARDWQVPVRSKVLNPKPGLGFRVHQSSVLAWETQSAEVP